MTAPVREPGSTEIPGDNAQNAVANQVSGDLIQQSYRFVRGRPSMHLGLEEIEDRVRCHVAANNHDLVVNALRINRAVLLAGPLGCGRETTAIAAMTQLRPDIPIRRFSLEDEDAEEIYAKGGGYLVHAVDTGLSRLGSCLDAVRASDGYLVVIADGEAEPASTLPAFVIEPPHPVQVYRRRMAVRGLSEWWDWSEVPTLLEHALPADARRLTELIERIDGRGGDVASRQAEVTHAYRGWRNELRVWFRDHPEPHERALLIAAAALSPAEEANVYTVASSLARRLEITMSGAGLAWCPLTGLRRLLEADGQDGQVIFRRLDYAKSILRHAIADYPLARSDLLSWLAALPADDAVPKELRNPLAATFADLAAEYGPAGLIVDTAREWGRANHADLAFIALSQTCLHPRVGGPVRQALYKWSRTAHLPQTLKLVIARVCEPLGQTYPSIALTRLKHLATHGDQLVLGEVLAAARALAASGSHAGVLAAALSWCAETDPEQLSIPARQRRRRAGALLFLELAGPVTESGLPSVLDGDEAIDPMAGVPGWRAALDMLSDFGSGHALLEQVVHRWLDAALTLPSVRAGIEGSLVEAARPPHVRTLDRYGIEPRRDPTSAEIMIGVARRWALTDPARRQTKEDIVIPLMRPWLRCLMILYVQVRTLLEAERRRS
jgi:hypothetical protein